MTVSVSVTLLEVVDDAPLLIETEPPDGAVESGQLLPDNELPEPETERVKLPDFPEE